MPTYHYKCTSCGNEIERKQSIVDKPLTECISCHKNTYEKVVYAADLQFKGPGFYCTDKKTGEKLRWTD